ncbi:hotdog family protein [Puniceicoccus vermicola]|uniref:ApeI dehydratase-like domain-containing protein n=1 Tax=Puniceicoccus vermicola TaxID=388746 RepID=A0A7X1AWF3_9BACT|nr:hypothetical protein [Puniceicoccus vermicola]MBC2601044.1 hypothetical protein [Puniceicoccus vermicola]
MSESTSQRHDPLHLVFERGSQETTIHIPEDGKLFAGHFDDYPIAPGALMLDWMFRQAEAAGVHQPQRNLLRSRFMREVKPGDTVIIRCRPAQRGLLVEVARGEEISAKAWFQMNS